MKTVMRRRCQTAWTADGQGEIVDDLRGAIGLPALAGAAGAARTNLARQVRQPLEMLDGYDIDRALAALREAGGLRPDEQVEAK